jgi:hypothetical protein
MREDLKGTSTSLKASASSDSTAGDPSSSTGNKKKKHNNQGVMEAATGINSLVAMLQDKNQKDIQFMAEQEKRAARQEHLEFLKSGVFSPGTAKTIKESMLESLGIKRKIDLTAESTGGDDSCSSQSDS